MLYLQIGGALSHAGEEIKKVVHIDKGIYRNKKSLQKHVPGEEMLLPEREQCFLKMP